jgi:hypothetical protein
MKINNILSNWNFSRLLRLILAIVFLIQAFQSKDYWVGAFGILLLFQAATNQGCCATNGCNFSKKNDTNSSLDDVQFEEVKTK